MKFTSNNFVNAFTEMFSFYVIYNFFKYDATSKKRIDFDQSYNSQRICGIYLQSITSSQREASNNSNLAKKACKFGFCKKIKI